MTYKMLWSLQLSGNPLCRMYSRSGYPALEEIVMWAREIYITEFDIERLRKLLERSGGWSKKDREFLRDLEDELDRAVVVAPQDVPCDVVTMNSRVCIKDLDTAEEMILRLTFPSDADFGEGKVSIMAPIGTAIIGYRAGDTVTWKVPGGVRRLKIVSVLYQPEAAGDYHL